MCYVVCCSSFVSIGLPLSAKKNGVRLRWWQPSPPLSRGGGGAHARSDWAIDDIIIGGKESNPSELHDDFLLLPQNDDNGRFPPASQPTGAEQAYSWLSGGNMRRAAYCGSAHAIVGELQSPGKQSVIKLMTSDMRIGRGYIVQFSINIGCDAPWDAQLTPVHFQYSHDQGVLWRLVVDECHDVMSERLHLNDDEALCESSVGSEPSVYYAARGWRRITIPLYDIHISK